MDLPLGYSVRLAHALTGFLLQRFAIIEPEKFIQIENTFAGSAATALPKTPTASALAMPPFWPEVTKDKATGG